MFKTLLVLAGIGQIALAISSLAIPGLLGWRQEIATLRPLTRAVFWTYAGYIFGIHLWFGIMSIAAAGPLAAGGLLPTFVTGFIALYWAVRVVGQFAWYDRAVAADRLLFRLAEVAYVALFVALTLIYAAVATQGLWR